MASAAGNVLKIFLLLLLIAVLIVGGAIWFDYLGVIDAKEQLSPVTSLLGLKSPEVLEEVSQPIVLDRERMNMQIEALNLLRDELAKREAAVDLAEAEILQKQTELDEKEKALVEKEKSINDALNRYNNKQTNLEQNARYLEGMPPEDAVSIMMNMENLDVVDVLRTAERLAQEEGRNSLVSYWISLMTPEKGAAIQKLMADEPTVN
ncbi:periplasmic-type flagellar collar protein FlbB [Spirochaeta isovalerica]|uniref:Flagellar protein FlbB n=1 Tax=Spirochaeta isovalerica TaxID=150 RepID=A0A841REB3_9SPIO|nr:flagellar protein FlbB [Spirochaeta isovalerica]MBB6481956.1 flagellar protein FlbB [Spirochaeta isovalerica]